MPLSVVTWKTSVTFSMVAELKAPRNPMALAGDDDSFTEKLGLPLPPSFSCKLQYWEEWSWIFKAYLAVFDAQAAAFLDAHELEPLEVTDEDLNVSVFDDQRVTSVDRAATAVRVTFIVESCITCLRS